MTQTFETFSGSPSFTLTNVGDGDSVSFAITQAASSVYSRIYQTTNIASTQAVVVTPITGASYTISGLYDNTYYWFAMDSVAEISGSQYNVYNYNFGPYGGALHLEDGQITGYKVIYVTSNSSGQASQMQLPRLMDLSLIYFLRDSFTSVSMYPTDMDIIDGYPEDKRNLVGRGKLTNNKTQKLLPVITVEKITTTRQGLEVGSRDSLALYNFSIDIFAEKDGQRDDLAYLCVKFLNNTIIPVKNYNEGFPPTTTTQTISGYMDVLEARTVNTSQKNSPHIADRHSSRIVLTVNIIEKY